MDTFTTAKVQMSDTITSLNKLANDNDDDDDGKLQQHQQHMFEGDENQENNGLKRQRLNDTGSVQMSKIRNKMQQHQQLQTCAAGDHMHENHLQAMRCLTTATESPTNPTNGTIPLKVATTQPNSLSNGFHRIENGRESVLSTPSDDILAQLCDGQSEGYLDSMVSSDLSDADMKLAVEKENATIVDGLSNGADQNGCDRAINRGHRRTRARSSDSIQAEFYQARKMRLQLQHDSDVS